MGWMWLWMSMWLACSTTPSAERCDALAGEDRSWCRYELAVHAADGGDPEQALTVAATIETAAVRAALYDQLFSKGLPGVDQPRAHAICEDLPAPHAEGCKRTWDRPHLWDRR